MIVVDSSVWIDFFRKARTPQVDTLLQYVDEDDADVLVSDLVMLEVLVGARDDLHADRLERELRRFAVVSMMSDTVAVEAARIYRTLRGEGVTIRKTVDLAIAAFCLMNGHVLLQSDRDFTAIAGRFPLRLA